MKKTLSIITLFLTIFLLTSCGDKKTSHIFSAMDTTISVEIYDGKNEHFTKVEDIFVLYSQLSTKHRRNEVESSHKYYNLENIYTINENAGIKAVTVKDELIELIEYGILLHEKTNGYFHIGLGHLVEVWKDAIDSYLFITEEKYNEILTEATEVGAPDLDKIVIDKANKTIFLKDDSIELDFGALSKGYALEKAILFLKENGVKKYKINAGSSSIAYGVHPDNRPFAIGIKDAYNKYENGYFGVLKSKDETLSTSGNSEQFLTVRGDEGSINSKMIHHIISPVTFKPENHYHSVTLIGLDAGLLDAYSTAVFLMELEEALLFLEEENIKYIIYKFDYSVLTNLSEDDFTLSKLL